MKSKSELRRGKKLDFSSENRLKNIEDFIFYSALSYLFIRLIIGLIEKTANVDGSWPILVGFLAVLLLILLGVLVYIAATAAGNIIILPIDRVFDFFEKHSTKFRKFFGWISKHLRKILIFLFILVAVILLFNEFSWWALLTILGLIIQFVRKKD